MMVTAIFIGSGWRVPTMAKILYYREIVGGVYTLSVRYPNVRGYWRTRPIDAWPHAAGCAPPNDDAAEECDCSVQGKGECVVSDNDRKPVLCASFSVG
jgi:hypothetical protein